MFSLFAILLSLSGLAVMVWLTSQRREIMDAFGGTGPATALIGFALITNLVPLAVPAFGSVIMGMSALGLLAWILMSSTTGSLVSPPDTWLRASWLMVGLLVIWCFSVDSLVAFGLYGSSRMMAYVAAGVIFLAVGLMSGRAAFDTRAITYVGLFVLSVLTMPTYWLSSEAWRPCTTGELEKCSVAGALFKSFYSSENYIAILASFTFIACLCSMRRRQLLTVGSFCLLIIVATGSRTSFLGIGAASLWLVGGLVLERRRQYFRVPVSICLALTVPVVGLATYLVWNASPNTLSNRGRIWISAREYLSEMTVTGVGVSKWYFLRDVGDSPQHFFHSGYVTVLFSGGFVALSAWAIWATALMRGAVHDGRAFSAKAPVVLLLVYSLTEVIWNPITVDGFSWILVALMLTQSSSPEHKTAPARSTAAAESPSEESERPKEPRRKYLSAGRGPRQELRSGALAARASTSREAS